jgi:hypothetical protein
MLFWFWACFGYRKSFKLNLTYCCIVSVVARESSDALHVGFDLLMACVLKKKGRERSLFCSFPEGYCDCGDYDYGCYCDGGF